jgi:hypothetical protein
MQETGKYHQARKEYAQWVLTEQKGNIMLENKEAWECVGRHENHSLLYF